MSTGARTFGLDQTFLEPKVLPPPPTRHALLACLIALAAIVHIGTSGWSNIHNGAEGDHAGAAREMLHVPSWSVPRHLGVATPNEPPLLDWLILGSYKIFGVTAMAARVPIALAMIASIALTFLIGEQLVDYRRGFIAGLIYLGCVGSFVWGRIITPEPLLAAFLGGAICCALLGYRRQRTRRVWFAGVWICAAFACLTSGLVGLLYPIAIFVLLAILLRDARRRFRALLDWRYLLLFLALLAPWLITAHGHVLPLTPANGMPLGRFLLTNLVWLFPAIVLLPLPMIFAARKIFRPHEFDLAEALPLCWLAVGFLPLLFLSSRQDYQTLSAWSAFALWTALVWDRTPQRWRIAGLSGLALAGIALGGAAVCDLTARLPELPAAWLNARSVLLLIGLAFFVCSLGAIAVVVRRRETVALTLVFLAMVPIGLSIAEGMARFGSYLSLANAARFLELRLGAHGEVLFEGNPEAGSSLLFYLERAPEFVNERVVLEKMAAPHPVYLIIDKQRFPFWQDRLIERFHIYHQATTCGNRVVLSNQP